MIIQFFVLGRFVAIPSPVPNTTISVQYGLLAFMAVVYGPVAGALIGLIGHALIDFSYGYLGGVELQQALLAHVGLVHLQQLGAQAHQQAEHAGSDDPAPPDAPAGARAW